jgi:hypothetical protein
VQTRRNLIGIKRGYWRHSPQSLGEFWRGNRVNLDAVAAVRNQKISEKRHTLVFGIVLLR